MTLFMDMALGLKTPPPKHENIPKLEFSLGLGTKMTLFMDMGLGLKTPPQT